MHYLTPRYLNGVSAGTAGMEGSERGWDGNGSVPPYGKSRRHLVSMQSDLVYLFYSIFHSIDAERCLLRFTGGDGAGKSIIT